MARRLRQNGDYLLAANKYDEAHLLEPEGNACLFSALCIRDAGDDEEFFRRMAKYTTDRPTDFDGWVSLGNNHRRLVQFESAERCYRKCLEIREDIPVRNALVSMFFKRGKCDQARAEGLAALQVKDRKAMGSSDRSVAISSQSKKTQRDFDPGNRRANIISFSLWGSKPEYVSGAIVNAQIAGYMYPGWTPRFYVDDSVPADAVSILRRHRAEVVYVRNEDPLRDYKNFWRFLPNDDNSVNVFICRDTDSRINVKEVNSVYRWLKTDHAAHVMRDHIMHHELILAGMWGMRCGVIPNFSEAIASNAGFQGSHFADQVWLGDYVWPRVRDDVLIHDSVYGFPEASAFPGDFDLPGKMHVGAGLKTMPHWSQL